MTKLSLFALPHIEARPLIALLAAPACAAAAHALVATAVADHDRAADVAGGRISQVNHFGKRISGMDGRTRPRSLLVARWRGA